MADEDRVLDSITHLEERSNKIRTASQEAAHAAAHAEENRVSQQEQRERSARLTRADELEVHAGLIKENETREMLLDRIRKMREEKPAEIVHVGYRSPDQQKAFEAEQKAGREAVARAEAEAERFREARLSAEAADRARQGDMVPVHHPNPDMDAQFPTINATLGPKKK